MTAQPTPTPTGPERIVAAANEFARQMRFAAISAGRKMAAFVKATQETNRKGQAQP